MHKKPFQIVLALMTISLLLTACGGGAQAPSESAETTLRVWTHQNDAFNDGLQALADSYMAEHPEVAITFETFDYDTYIQTLQTALPAGTEADILQMFGSWVCSYAEGGNLAEVPEAVLSLQDAREQVYEAQIAGYICDEKLYGIPQEFNIEYGAILVNTAIAEEVGIADITSGWADWDEFTADAVQMAAVQDGVMTRSGFNFTGSDGISAAFYSLILQFGGQYLTDDGFQVNTPEGRQALELMVSLVDAGVVDPVLFNDESNWVGDSFFEQTSAMGLVGPWVVPEYSGDFEDVAAVTQYVPLPWAGSTRAFVASSGWGLAVSANSPAQEAAWDFVRYAALNADNATQWNLASGTLPALKANASGANAEALVAEFSHFSPFLDILEYAQHEGHFPDRDLVWYDITYPRILNCLQGNATIDETLELLEREVNESF